MESLLALFELFGHVDDEFELDLQPAGEVTLITLLEVLEIIFLPIAALKTPNSASQ
jgi:hypothetical protein